jgi:alpha-tubulin suppressor-like RCC1 family protein
VFSLALAGAAGAVSTGTASSFGSDELGQLGNGAGGSSSTPVAVAGLTGVTETDGGREHVVALRSDRTVWARAWGQHNDGQLGDGTKTNRSVPTKVAGLARPIINEPPRRSTSRRDRQAAKIGRP